LPERCQGCDAPAKGGLCQACLRELKPVRDPCPRCGLTRPVARCPRLTGEWWIGSIVAPFGYESPLIQHIHALKFLSARRMGRTLGLALVAQLRTRTALPSIDALVPVPLHRKRLLHRGFNQSVEIARGVAAQAGHPLLISGIARNLHTQPQTLLGAGPRHRNLRDAFVVRRRLDGMRLAIVDDVITTGATVNALAHALHEAGAHEVHAWAVARASVPKP